MLVFAGCDFNKNQTDESFKNPYAEVGQLHNQSLDRVLADLKTVQDPVESKEELFDVAEAGTRAFFKEKGAEAHAVENVERGRKLVEDVPQRLGRAHTSSTVDHPSPRAVAALPDSVLAELTSEQVQYIREIAGLVKGNPPVDQLKDQLSTLSQSALDELGKEDAAVVLQASAVAKSSYTYWVEHIEEWLVAVSQAASGSSTAGEEDARSAMLATNNFTSDVAITNECGSFLASADDVTWADLAGGLFGAAGAGAASAVQAAKEATDYAQCDSKNDIGWQGT
jgi:hypothetical protein